MGDTQRGNPRIMNNSAPESGAINESFQNLPKVLRFPKHFNDRGGGLSLGLSPSSLRMGRFVLPEATIRYHAREFVTAGTGNGPNLITLR